MMEIKIVSGRYPDGRAAILVTSPYHPDFPSLARNLGGRWDSNKRVWHFDARDEAAVRAALVQTYGTDGSAPVDLVDIELDLDAATRSNDNLSYWFAGRELARAFGRDSGARLSEGVRLLTGALDSAGSARHPKIWHQAGTTVLVRDLPRSLVTLGEHVRLHSPSPTPASSPIPETFRQAFAS